MLLENTKLKYKGKTWCLTTIKRFVVLTSVFEMRGIYSSGKDATAGTASTIEQ
jgi:hypothetical protein